MTTTIVRGTARLRLTLRPVPTEADRAWAVRALCRGDVRYSDGPFGEPIDPHRIARQLAHGCRAHCPVIEQCAAELLAQRPTRPRRAVRAGVWFPDDGRPKVLDDSRCGAHCDGLPAVHRKAATR